MNLKIGLIVSTVFAATAASAQIRITEWMYDGSAYAFGGVNYGGEFVEITNVGTSAINLAGYKYDDDSRDATIGVDLSAFGILGAGKSAVFTEATAEAFRSFWGLSASVPVIGGVTTNLGRADEINIFNASNALVDRLTYADATGNGPRTQNTSGNIPKAALGLNTATAAVLSSVGDVYASRQVGPTNNGSFYVGNPGAYAPVPEPASMLALGLGALGLIRRVRKA